MSLRRRSVLLGILLLPSIVKSEIIRGEREGYKPIARKVGDKMPRPSFTRRPTYKLFLHVLDERGKKKRVGVVEGYESQEGTFGFVRRDCNPDDFARPVAAFDDYNKILYTDFNGNKYIDDVTDKYHSIVGATHLPKILLKCERIQRGIMQTN